MHPFHRSELLFGREGFAKVQGARACVVGLGGVGSYAAEALVRAGFGHVTMVDFDRVCITNVNRQLHATRRTVGDFKTDLMAARAGEINRKADVRIVTKFYGKDSDQEILDPGFDWVLDCIDQMSGKLDLLESCVKRGLPVVSSMGAAGRLDPTRIRVSDLFEVTKDPFGRIVRKMLRRRGVDHGIHAVWSDEEPLILDQEVQSEFQCVCPDKDIKERYSCESRFQIQGSSSWMPPMFGLAMAGFVVNQVLGKEVQRRPGQSLKRSDVEADPSDEATAK